MDRLEQLQFSDTEQETLDSVMPGGKKWQKLKADGGDCLNSCPHFDACVATDGQSPANVCSTRWRKSEPSPEVFAVLVHVTSEFKHYNAGDLPIDAATWEAVAGIKSKVQAAEVDALVDRTFLEGSLRLRTHYYRERNTAAARDFKSEAFRAKRLICAACNVDFYALYKDEKELAMRAVECHHTIPLGSNEHTGNTKTSDLALLCAICHRIAHAGPEVIPLDKLQQKVRLPRRDRSNLG